MPTHLVIAVCLQFAHGETSAPASELQGRWLVTHHDDKSVENGPVWSFQGGTLRVPGNHGAGHEYRGPFSPNTESRPYRVFLDLTEFRDGKEVKKKPCRAIYEIKNDVLILKVYPRPEDKEYPKDFALEPGADKMAFKRVVMEALRSLVVFEVGRPVPVRLTYSGGVEDWNAGFVVQKGHLCMLNAAVLTVKDGHGTSLSPREGQVFAEQIQRLCPEPFDVTVDIAQLFDLSKVGKYCIEWGCRKVKTDKIWLEVVRERARPPAQQD